MKIYHDKVGEFITSLIVFLAICAIWMWLELLFYGEVQPRVVDDIIGLILFVFIYEDTKHVLGNKY